MKPEHSIEKDCLFIFRKTSLAFQKKCLNIARELLSSKFNIQVRRSRFIFEGYHYPLNLVVFDHPNQLGFFNIKNYRIGINKRLMFESTERVLQNIICHELAHYICYLKHPDHEKAHGLEFQSLCRSYNLNEEVSRASINIAQEAAKSINQEHDYKIIKKISKILKLSASSNFHESKMATLKANELLLKHNLESLYLSEEELDQQDTVMKIVLVARKNNAKLHAINEILSLFYVYPIFNYGKKQVYLEVIGTRVNVEMAHYVADFLDKKMDDLWLNTKKNDPRLKGPRAKNSFFKGVAEGFIQKMKTGHSELLQSHSKEVIKINKNLTDRVHQVYPKLTRSLVTQSHDIFAKRTGHAKGKELIINPALSTAKHRLLLESK